MEDLILLFSILTILVCVQTILGVGILVLGTPILLILNFKFLNILSILLPLSISTSLINILFFKYKYRFKELFNKNIKEKFLYYCIPSIFFGLIFLKFYGDVINFKILVSLIILFSLFVKFRYDKIKIYTNQKLTRFVFILIGIIHGVSNSGGSLLSIFLLKYFDNAKSKTRINVTYVYFFLALFQYLFFLILFPDYFDFYQFIKFSLPLILGYIIGNYFLTKISTTVFEISIYIAVFISAIFLIIYN